MTRSFHPRIFAEGQKFACLQRGIIFSGKEERKEQKGRSFVSIDRHPEFSSGSLTDKFVIST